MGKLGDNKAFPGMCHLTFFFTFWFVESYLRILQSLRITKHLNSKFKIFSWSFLPYFGIFYETNLQRDLCLKL